MLNTKTDVKQKEKGGNTFAPAVDYKKLIFGQGSNIESIFDP